jgi:8-oxo-dGTP diphosphatase
MEETGYQIKDVTLLTIRDNPDRPHEDRQNIAFVYFCTATDKVGKADWESDERRWFRLDEVPAETMAFDHYKNIKLYQQYLHTRQDLPMAAN